MLYPKILTLFALSTLLLPACASAEDDSSDTEIESTVALTSSVVALRYAAHGAAIVDAKTAPDAKVFVHYHDTDGRWKDAEARLLRARGERSFFYVTDLPSRRFAIHYTGGGRDVWDNNGGRDYDANKDPLGPGVDLALTSLEVNTTGTAPRLVVDAVLRKKGERREVWVDYSLDGWRSQRSIAVTDQVFGEHFFGALFIDGLDRAGRVELQVRGQQDLPSGGRQAVTNDNLGKRFACKKAGDDWRCSGEDLLVFDPNVGDGRGGLVPSPPRSGL